MKETGGHNVIERQKWATVQQRLLINVTFKIRLKICLLQAETGPDLSQELGDPSGSSV